MSIASLHRKTAALARTLPPAQSKTISDQRWIDASKLSEQERCSFAALLAEIKPVVSLTNGRVDLSRLSDEQYLSLNAWYRLLKRRNT